MLLGLRWHLWSSTSLFSLGQRFLEEFKGSFGLLVLFIDEVV